VQLDTLRGPLRLEGSGTVKEGRVSFKGRASSDPEMRSLLIGLIGVLGRRVGDEAIISLET
jgi:general secretion pathway protein N